jgi:hypothetical protein
MPQTTNALSWANCAISLSADGTNWTDVSGFANSVAVDGGERATAEFFTVEGDTPIVTAGKRGFLDITVKAVYTEAGSDAYAMGQAAYEGNSPLYLKWIPKGSGVGAFVFTTSIGRVTKPIYPQGAADSADAIQFELGLSCGAITKSALGA